MPPAPAPVLRVLLAGAAACCALAACSGSDGLDVDGFSPGACTELAPTLEAVDERLREVKDEDLSPKEAAAGFKAAQEELKTAGADGSQEVSSAVTDLVTSLGFFRISADSGTYDGSQVKDVRAELDAVAETCRD